MKKKKIKSKKQTNEKYFYYSPILETCYNSLGFCAKIKKEREMRPHSVIISTECVHIRISLFIGVTNIA